MRKKNVWGLLVAATLVASPAWAGIPSAISVQGVLRDADGALQSIPVNVTTNFYDAQTAGNTLAGPYIANGVMAVNGLFTISINDGALGSKLAGSTTGEVWLELTAGNDIYPRQKVNSEVFALQCSSASDAAQLGGKPPASYLLASDAASTYQLKGSYLTTTGTAADSAKLGGAAASAFQKVLSPATCPSGQAYSAIAANGNATCTGTVSSAGTATSFTGALTGDVSGGQSTTKVGALQGVAVSSTAPTTSGQVLKYDGTKWGAGSDNNSGGTVTSVAAGTGLTGGPITSTGTLSAAFGGTGSASTVARSDHSHSLVFTQAGAGSYAEGPLGEDTKCAACPSGTVAVSGNCSRSGNALNLMQSYVSGNSWCCTYYNSWNGGSLTWYYSANCLKVQ